MQAWIASSVPLEATAQSLIALQSASPVQLAPWVEHCGLQQAVQTCAGSEVSGVELSFPPSGCSASVPLKPPSVFGSPVVTVQPCVVAAAIRPTAATAVIASQLPTFLPKFMKASPLEA